MSWRPMVSTWRKPAVVTRAVRAPLPSRIMLVATVVPCSTRPKAGAWRPASSKASRTPVRKAWLGSVGIGVAMEGLGRRPLRAQLRGRCLVDGAVRESDAVKPLGGIGGHEAAQDVLEHFLGRPVERMAMAAAAAGLDPEHVAVPEHVA